MYKKAILLLGYIVNAVNVIIFGLFIMIHEGMLDESVPQLVEDMHVHI